MRCADGWVAASLARADDLELVPAWLEVDVPDGADVWELVEAELARRSAASVVERGVLVGLPVAALGEREQGREPVIARRFGNAAPIVRSPQVVDLSALWAGPLCARGAAPARRGRP